MTFFQKSIGATALLLVAFWQLGSMTVARGWLGSASPRVRQRLTSLHRYTGYLALAIMLVVAYYCLRVVRKSGPEVFDSARVSVHSILASSAFLLLFSKIAVNRMLKRYYRRLPVLGVLLFSSIVILWATSAGWYFWND